MLNKITLLLLPFLAMQADGDETPPAKSRNDLFVEGLGLSQEVKDQLSNGEVEIGEVIKGFQNGYSSLLKQTHQNSWDEEKRNALIKETQTGSHNAFQSKMLKEFGLDAEKFKDVDKKTEAILLAAKESYSNQLADLKAKLDGKTDATSKQLQEQLDLRNSEYETLSKEIAELRKFKEEFPTLKESIINQERDRQWISSQIAFESEKIENKNAAASLNMINLLINQIATIEAVSDEKGNKSIVIKDKRTDAPFMRSATDNYKDLNTFITEEVLKKNKLINLQNPPSSHQNGNSGQQQTPQTNGRKPGTISNRALDRAK